jgi:hypothetical protein
LPIEEGEMMIRLPGLRAPLNRGHVRAALDLARGRRKTIRSRRPVSDDFVDQIAIVDGVICAAGWTTGADPVLVYNGDPFAAQVCVRYPRPGVAGKKDEGFRIAAAVPENTIDNSKVAVRFDNGNEVGERKRAGMINGTAARQTQAATPVETQPGFDRTATMFGQYDVAGKRGIEFGALSRPLLRDVAGVTVHYVDHLSTEEIKKKYLANENIRQEDIVDVSYVADGRPLREIIPHKYDFALGSHVGEHVPDLLGWWNELAEILVENGQIVLALPDKRRCFDIIRRLSSTADVVGAWLEQRKKPSAAASFEQGAYTHIFNGAPVWMQLKPPEELNRSGTLAKGLERARQAATEYVDTHCWVFTPRSFMAILRDLAEMQILPFKVRHFQIPPQTHAEFYVCLQKCADPVEIAASIEWARAVADSDPLPEVWPQSLP